MSRRLLVALAVFGPAVGLLLAAPARADDPVRVSDEGVPSTLYDTATDREGDTVMVSAEQPSGSGVFALRLLRADGSRGWTVSWDRPDLWAQVYVSVDDDGDGVVVWDSIDEASEDLHAELHARRFTRDGALGPVLDIGATTYIVDDIEIGIRPEGTAIVTWQTESDTGYRTLLRTVDAASRLGPILTVAGGPQEPMIAVERSGRATLVWSTERRLHARRLRTDGSLSPTRLIRRRAYPDESLTVQAVAVDRDGAITGACTRYTRNTAFPTFPSNSYSRACLFDTTPRLRLRRDVRFIGPEHAADFAVVGLTPSGRGVVGWQRNYYEGAYLRPIRTDGSLGAVTRLASGGMGEIALRPNGDGYVSSSHRAADGQHRIVRLTTLRDGRVRSSRDVFTSAEDLYFVTAGTGTRGPATLAWTDQGSANPEVLAVVAR